MLTSRKMVTRTRRTSTESLSSNLCSRILLSVVDFDPLSYRALIVMNVRINHDSSIVNYVTSILNHRKLFGVVATCLDMREACVISIHMI